MAQDDGVLCKPQGLPRRNQIADLANPYPSVTQRRWSHIILNQPCILSTTYFTNKNVISNIPHAVSGVDRPGIPDF